MGGNRIREARLRRGWSQRYTAKLLGVSHNTLSLWEADITHPKATRMREVAELLGIPVQDLIPRAA